MGYLRFVAQQFNQWGRRRRWHFSGDDTFAGFRVQRSVDPESSAQTLRCAGMTSSGNLVVFL